MIMPTVTNPKATQMLFWTDAQVVLAFSDHVLSGTCELTKLLTTIIPTSSMTIMDMSATTTPPTAFLFPKVFRVNLVMGFMFFTLYRVWYAKIFKQMLTKCIHMTRKTGYLSTPKSRAFKQKAKDLGITEYALATIALNDVLTEPRSQIREHEFFKKAKEFFESGKNVL